MKRYRVCFHHAYLYPALREGVEFAGGAELQQAILMRRLAARGFEVVGVTCDFGQPARTQIEGIEVLGTYPPVGGIRALRFFHPRLTRTLAALEAASADLYYVRGAGFTSGITYDVARWQGAAFVFGTAHDSETLRHFPRIPSLRDRWWARRALRGADARIAQTEFQQAQIRDQFGLSSVVVRNVVEVPERATDPGTEGAVVWLGTYKREKRPEWFTALARALPDRRFLMYGVVPPPPWTPETWEETKAEAEALPNLDVQGFLPHARLGEVFGSASLFVHTSPVEGFPNTVLEAWAFGVPTVTAVDPDGIVEREGVGEVRREPGPLVDAVRGLMADPSRRRRYGERARDYVKRHHDPDRLTDRLAEIFVRAIENKVRSGKAVRRGRAW